MGVAPRSRPWPLACVLLGLFGCGAAAGIVAWEVAPLRALQETAHGLEGPWRVHARVVREPQPTVGGATLTLEADRVLSGGRWARTRGRVEVGLPRLPAAPMPAGTRVEVFLRLRGDRPPANAGLPRRDRLGVRGIDLRARLKSPEQLRVIGAAPPAARGATALRTYIRATLDERLGTRSAEAAALILGERGEMDDASMIRLARSGLIHLFAISGLHVGLAAAGAAGLLRVAGASPRMAAGGAMAAAAGIGLLVAPAAPVRRAALMALAIGAGIVAGRRHHAGAALALAVFAIVWLDPRVLHAPGFRMSALATFGLLIAWSRGASRRGRVMSLLTGTAVAQAWVAPVVADAGAPLPLSPLVLNLAAVPLLGLVLVALVAVLLLEPWSVAGADLLGAAAESLLEALAYLAAVGAAGPALFLTFTAVTALGWWMALLLLSAGAMFAGYRLWRFPGFCLLIVTGLVAALPPSPADHAALDVLDVGQGDAVHLYAAPEHLLVDGGGYAGLDYDVGAHLVVPALRRLGVRHLDAVALSHAHADHGGGLPAAIAAFDAAEIWIGVTPPLDPLLATLRAARADATLLMPRGPARRLGSCTLRTLLPPANRRRNGLRRVENEASLVQVVSCGEVDVWLTGDAGIPAEAGWDPDPGRRALLKVGHHGSASATSAAFLDRLRPRHAVLSVGARNAYGLPRTEVLKRIRDRAIALYRTDRDGALHLSLGDRVRVRGERWSAGG